MALRLAIEDPAFLKVLTEPELWKHARTGDMAHLTEELLAQLDIFYQQTGRLFYPLLDRIRSLYPEMAEYLTQEMLYAAARRDDLASFCQLLDHVPAAC